MKRQGFWLAMTLAAWGASGFVRAGSQDNQEAKTPEDRLFRAADQRDAAAVRALLKQGVNPNAPNQWKTPPLVNAASRSRQDLEVLRLLLDHGADMNGTDPGGNTALMEAVQWEHDPFGHPPEAALNAIKLLLDRGARINAKNAAGDTALSLAMQLYRSHYQIVRLLLERGADISVKGAENYAPLHYAAYANATDRVKALLKAGADVNAKDAWGRTPLILAAEGGAIDTLQALLDGSANINALGVEGRTALLTALRSEAVDAALLLVQKGADVNAKDQFGGTPLTLALRLMGMPRGVQHADFPTVEAHIKQEDALIDALLEKGADVNVVGDSFYSPLIEAIERERFVSTSKHVNWVKPLLDKGADSNAKSVHYGSALFAAIERERANLDIPKWLIEKGADVNAAAQADYETLTVLLSAIRQEDFALARLLVEKGAKVECFDGARKTPLLWAAYHGQLDLAKALLAHGANIQAMDKMGQNALALARKGQHSEMVAFLQQQRLKPSAAAPAATPNPLGQTVITLPLTLRKSAAGIQALSFSTDASKGVARLLILREKQPYAEPVTFGALLTDARLWTHEELNDILYQLQRGYYTKEAYRFFGLIVSRGETYLGLLWYSPAASAQHQTYQFVFRLRALGKALKLTVVRKAEPRGGMELSVHSPLPELTKSSQGDLLLTDGTGRYKYLPTNGRWLWIGPPPKT